MSHSENTAEGHTDCDAALSVYAAAAASCDGPQLLPFVRFNDSHLPSSFPSTFLAAHAAFCIKDGEAPQIPDYLVMSRHISSAKSTSTREPEDAITSARGSGSSTEVTEQNVGGKLCSFQCKALRRTLDFQKLQGIDINSIKNPLIEYLKQSQLDNASPPQKDEALDSKLTREGGKYQNGQQPTGTAADALANPLLAEDAAVPVKTASLPAAEGVSHDKDKTGECKVSGELDNPLLDDLHGGEIKTPANRCYTELPGKLSDSEAPTARRKRGLNSAAMRHKNLEQVSNECMGNNLCLSQAACGHCLARNCNKDHDVAAYMKARPDDLSGDCVFFSRYGICPYGCCCRFGRSHLDPSGVNLLHGGRPATVADLQKYQESHSSEELNVLIDQSKTFVPKHRRRSRANDSARFSAQSAFDSESSSNPVIAASQQAPTAEAEAPARPSIHESEEDPGSSRRMGAVAINDDDVRPEERRQRFVGQVRGKTFLAPLTTVGNLPFRRLCTRLGADVTVSEMAVANSLVEGKPSELCLLKRHHTEKIFGVQIAAGFPDVAYNWRAHNTAAVQFGFVRTMVLSCGRMLHNRNISCDFIDLNIACPLDQLHRKFKAGSCMLEKPAAVESVVESLVKTWPSTPVTIKVRTAHYGKRHQLHSIIGRLSRSGVAAIFAHGRTAQQRYSKSADWNYLTKCKELMAEDVLLVGCGDIFSSAEFQYRQQTAGLDALMIGRGALIKPWIFTEIKEQRLWDVSASERLSFVKEFVDNGLEHWGSDRRGVATTRRFLLELLSFMHRYIPPVFLELQPQLIHWRPSPFKGRSDLEVKLSSPNPQDWVEISSMFLGPPPKGFTFVPKHASNAYYVADS